MQANLPVWAYYPYDKKTGDQQFIDPLYAPYMKTIIPGSEEGMCGVNIWKQPACPEMSNPALERRGWGQRFQLMNEWYPCPNGWTKVEDGYCVPSEREYGNDRGLYSKHAFVPRYQYWDSYAPKAKNPRFREISEFDMKSVSPNTGEYVVYFNGKSSGSRSKYGLLPSKDSYLA